jgi:fatty-acyl-CoA synthase
MKGYLKNPTETEKSFKHGLFQSGDLGSCRINDYIELQD